MRAVRKHDPRQMDFFDLLYADPAPEPIRKPLILVKPQLSPDTNEPSPKEIINVPVQVPAEIDFLEFLSQDTTAPGTEIIAPDEIASAVSESTEDAIIAPPENDTSVPQNVIPSAVITKIIPQNYRIKPEDELFPKSINQKIEANLRAITTLKTLEFKSDNPTEMDCRQLIQYTGWGGIPQVFDKNNRQFQKDYLYLPTILDQSEYDSARASTLSAFFTPPELIKVMWDIAAQLGFTGGRVGEFGAGVGHFIGLVPDSLAEKTSFSAIEMDMVSARICKMLYPQAEVICKSIEEVVITNGSLDLVIGNVPYCQQGVYDKNLSGFNLHNYCIARALNALKPGGLCVVLTSSWTMDSGNRNAREYFLQHAGLLAAFRLPNTAFKRSANTEVVCDLLILQKGATGKAMLDVGEIATGDDTGAMPANEYFIEHPEHILGIASNTGRMYGRTETPTVKPDPKRSFLSSLQEQAQRIEAQEITSRPSNSLFEDSAAEPDSVSGETLFGIQDRDYTIIERHGNIYQAKIGCAEPLLNRGKPLSGNEYRKARSYIAVKGALNNLIRMQLDPYENDENIEGQRDLLNSLYDDHLRNFGPFSNQIIHKLYKNDQDYLKLSATEFVRNEIVTTIDGIKTKKKHYVKGDIYSKRTQWPWREPASASTPEEAGLISYAYRQRIELNYIVKLLGLESIDEARDQILATGEFFLNPEAEEIELKSQYCSGNVVRKLQIAEEKAAENTVWNPNVTALKTVQPKPIEIDEIDFSLGSYWLPAEVIERWIQSEFNVTVPVRYHNDQDRWFVKPDYKAKYGFSDYTVTPLLLFDFIELALNLQEPVIHKEIYVEGEKKITVDQEATLTARQIKKDLMEKFRNYVLNTFSEIQTVEEIYNELFNNHVLRQYELPKFDVYPGAVSIVDGRKFVLYEHQKRAVTRCLEGNTLLAHCVGAGKTAIMVTASMELRRLRLATKCLIVVQNSTLEQFAEFAPRLYPNANILMADKKDLVKDKRKQFLSRIATGDWDMVIMAHSSFDMLQDDPDLVELVYEEQIEELEWIIAQAESKDTVKDIERQKKTLKKRLKQIQDKERCEDIMYFHELGIDALFIDEAHNYKRNFFVTKKGRIKGLDRGSSKRAFSLSLKIRHIREKTGGRNIYFSTGTPVTNTIAELWNMVRYISPETLQEYHIDTFDRFASTFTGTEIALEIDAAGRFRMIERFSKYCNAIEMSKMFQTCADVITPEDIAEVERPPIKGGHPEKVKIERSEQITKFVRYLGDVYRWFENSTDKRSISHIPLLIYGLSRKCTIDMRLIHYAFQDDPDSKLNVCARKVIEKYHEYQTIKGTQVIFMDLYRNGNGKVVLFDAWEEMRSKLIGLGINPAEIAVINDCTTDKQRSDLFERVNSGDVRVIIGSTAKLGTGVNIQERLAVCHHIDAPFRPSDMEQRNGRIIRQGNMLNEVEIIQYGVEQTLDAGMYQILERKQKFITDAMKGRASRTMEELNQDTALDYANFSAIVSGNPNMQRKVVVDTRIRELEALESQYIRNNRMKQESRDELTRVIPVYETELAQAQQIIPKLPELKEVEVVFGSHTLRGTKKQMTEDLRQIILQKGFYPASQQARYNNQKTELKLDDLYVNGVRFELKVCFDHPFGRKVDWNTAYVLYVFADFKPRYMKMKLVDSCSHEGQMLQDILDILHWMPESLKYCENHLQILKAKLNGFENSHDQKFPYREEYEALLKEQAKLIAELNKTNPEFAGEFLIGDCPRLTEYFPEIGHRISESIETECTIVEEDDTEESEDTAESA